MVATRTPEWRPGSQAPDFSLRVPTRRSGRWRTAGAPAARWSCLFVTTVPMCRLCSDSMIRDAKELAALGVGSVAIMSNDTEAYPADAFPQMQRLATEVRCRFLT